MNSKAKLPFALLVCCTALGSACGGDKGDTAPVDSCPTFTDAPIDHSGFIEADETWEAGPHTVSYAVV